MCPPSCAFFQDLWRPQTRDQEEYIHLESVLHSGSQNANQLASNQWHIWTLHTLPISEEGWQSVMSLDAHEDEQRCRENHLLGNCELVRIRLRGHRTLKPPFFFCCIAELAIKPCRSSRSKLRGEFGIPNTCKTGNKNTTKQQTPPNQKHNTKQKTGKCLECETRGEKRVKRPKRPNALICRTPGGSMRYPLSSSLGMMLISHSIVSIPASPSRFAI